MKCKIFSLIRSRLLTWVHAVLCVKTIFCLQFCLILLRNTQKIQSGCFESLVIANKRLHFKTNWVENRITIYNFDLHLVSNSNEMKKTMETNAMLLSIWQQITLKLSDFASRRNTNDRNTSFFKIKILYFFTVI